MYDVGCGNIPCNIKHRRRTLQIISFILYTRFVLGFRFFFFFIIEFDLFRPTSRCIRARARAVVQ